MKTAQIFILFFVAIVIIGCNNDDNSIAIPTSDIIGNISLFDDEMTEVINSGMIVTIEETTPPITTLTDIDGNYLLENVPFGIYTLRFEKEGFGTHKVFEIDHENRGDFTLIPNELKLGQISNSLITETSVVLNGNFIILTVRRSDTENLLVKRMRVFYHTSDDVSSTNYTSFSPVIGTTANPASLTFSVAFFTSLGFESGSTVWFRVYGDNFYSNMYEDPNLGRSVFPNVNPNTVDAVSIILP
ncbi:carboxypeptidase-like regulatory domain-containing protein [Aquimarina sp. 2201CG5-10]|uniref:carboxypeptidase-like regulatory domain-containing protein n=1 Tax=Aquimarina callyspongiae TaxID=3098150 RepID=UPI002AB4106F|nr:carboxypeptidase-like regulatory domain-containing protein [Aquimarina sp. 2201CG5-10]MDY8135628.1 carboxypeptidase-like regulatory domain-containing protein [Aquimarina sp. 2201CG5-10]